ncbi:MAG: diphthine--ammonia ligase [Nanoarchaeota archaeon]|nr:diphthine--ammonia ligase [Nanoarchaeota archaeon]MCG2718740.1 diphthine--ammonia ligase [Nanoarchaeota archaeon]
MKLGALFSSGKDSSYALYLMKKRGHEISCLITVKSKNPDSFMFHTPNIDLTELQAKAMGIPLIEQESEGKKEHELEDLEKVMKRAKDEYGIEGVTTGALFSEYQSKRIQKICDKLGLKVFSPLWHKDQETEMREIIREGFKFIITKIAADGLDESWLGKVITEKDVDKLVKLNEKIGFNIAFEGGEAESLMIDGPNFKSTLIIEEAENVMENKFTGYYNIIKAKLISK